MDFEDISNLSFLAITLGLALVLIPNRKSIYDHGNQTQNQETEESL